jgi:hypothetical protein
LQNAFLIQILSALSLRPLRLCGEKQVIYRRDAEGAEKRHVEKRVLQKAQTTLLLIKVESRKWQ